jgi:hypothetical protein
MVDVNLVGGIMLCPADFIEIKEEVGANYVKYICSKCGRSWDYPDDLILKIIKIKYQIKGIHEFPQINTLFKTEQEADEFIEKMFAEYELDPNALAFHWVIEIIKKPLKQLDLNKDFK